ncbi:zinc-ribbon domain-containing protein [Acanthopleuribacter pedis]|uniref:Zinc-ribbon domain-containing protein n=1 Tax=Acanthopleuribacter pedis TaxID=442870 RepID=A0A8J7Q8U4_9BACT|nr:zinc-ribbon domain-containing protein [Acanthopleuribacter pedis]MBO1320025.1 zinc-ribbon domain-containing protein [Acanthopleuribacter pedis]
MIIACPSCNARYKVKDELIKEKGKKVKCKKCGAIFKAFRDKDSVLLKAAPGKEDDFKTRQVDPAAAAATAGIKVSVGAQAPAAPAPPPADPSSSEVAGQATVRVDRSKLQDYIKQSDDTPEEPPPPPSLDAFKQDPEDDFPLGNLDNHGTTGDTVQVDPNALAAQMGGDASATMAVDRSHIDQFLKQQVDEDDPLGELAGDDPLGADTADSGATMAFDRSQLDAMMNQREDDDLLGLGNVGGEPPPANGGDGGATMAVDRSQLDAFLNQNPSGDAQAPAPDPFATQEPPAESPQDAGATMAVDRSQIDAFLNQNQGDAGAPDPFATQEPPPADDTGATMAMDRDQLDAFLEQQQAPGEPSDELGLDETPGATNGAFEGDSGAFEGDTGATMAVDRSQIDAFLEQNQTPTPPPVTVDDDSLTFDETPDTGPLDEAGSTVAVDRSQLDAFLAQANEDAPVTDDDFAGLGDKPEPPPTDDPFAGMGGEPEPTDAPDPFAGMDNASEPTTDDPFGDALSTDNDPASGGSSDAFTTDNHPLGSGTDTQPAFGTGGDATATIGEPDVIDNTPISEPDPVDVAANHDAPGSDDPFQAEFSAPAFPSDDDLGIANEAADLGSPPAEGGDPFATVVSDEPPNFSDVDPSDFGENSPPPTDTIPHLDAEKQAQIQAEGALWQAWIDDQVYPDLTLETLERWIIEDRLLETDRLAPGGTEDFRRADEVPEVAAFFQKYNKSGAPTQATDQPKKGFFGWLKSLFKK